MQRNPQTSAHRYAPGWACICAYLMAAAGAGAQMHKVEAPQRVTRAVGVYEWTGDLKKPDAARLVPVTLFINGRYEDAGVYLARPEPFALQTGIAYEVDQAGKPLGTLNLDYARDVETRRSATDDNPISSWYGYGTLVLPTAATKPNLKPSAHLPVITSSGHDTGTTSDDDGKPHLARRAGSESDSTTTPSAGSTPAATTANSAPANPAPAADSDRPTLSRRQDNTSNAPASTTPTPTVGADDSDRPTLRHRDPADIAKPKKHEEGGAVIPVNTSLNDDPNRPTLHRGKPLGEISVAQLTGLPAALHQAVAVSDAGARDEHVFQREWASDSERAQTLAELETLARARIQGYITSNKLALTDPDAKPPTPATTPARSSRTRAAKPVAAPQPEVPLANEELNGYELTYGGLATFVYTVETPLFNGGPVYLTMVAQRLPAGNLQVAFSSMTDASHLDRTPWFRLVDAVDPDGSHRASLLFELRAQSTRQFALYRLITASAEQSFVSGIIE